MQKELLEQLKKDPQALRDLALEAGLITDDETTKLFSPIEVDDMASPKDIAKQFSDRLGKIQTWVNQTMAKNIKAAKDEVLNEAKQPEMAKIREFAKTHPEMKPNSDVLFIMEQLYAKDGNLEDAYIKSCVANGVKPVAIKEGKTINLSSGKEVGSDGKEVDDKLVENKSKKGLDTVSSLKSDMLSATIEDVEDDDAKPDKDISNLSVREIAESNWNKALAASGISEIPE